MSVVFEYVVVKCYGANELANTVNNKLKHGWQPIGGVSIACDENHDYFLQAMVKYEVKTEINVVVTKKEIDCETV